MRRKQPYPIKAAIKELSGALSKPSIGFCELIERFWFLDTRKIRDPFLEILPDGNFETVFIFNDSFCRFHFAGPYTKKTIQPLLPDSEYLGVSFRPGQIPLLADIRPAELVNTTIDLPKIPGITTDFLGEGLLGRQEVDARLVFIEHVFRKIGIESFFRKDLRSRCCKIVASCQGQIKVSELASQVGVSVRTLERTFMKDLGISPKMFIRVVRFYNTVKQLKIGGYPSLTQIAYEHGYADQAHFIKDVKTLSGKVPSAI